MQATLTLVLIPTVISGCGEMDSLSVDSVNMVCKQMNDKLLDKTKSAYENDKAMLTTADIYWRDGKPELAGQLYTRLVVKRGHFMIAVHEGNEAPARIFQRAAEYQLEQGNKSVIDQIIETAVYSNVRLKFTEGTREALLFTKQWEMAMQEERGADKARQYMAWPTSDSHAD